MLFMLPVCLLICSQSQSSFGINKPTQIECQLHTRHSAKSYPSGTFLFEGLYFSESESLNLTKKVLFEQHIIRKHENY